MSALMLLHSFPKRTVVGLKLELACAQFTLLAVKNAIDKIIVDHDFCRNCLKIVSDHVETSERTDGFPNKRANLKSSYW